MLALADLVEGMAERDGCKDGFENGFEDGFAETDGCEDGLAETDGCEDGLFDFEDGLADTDGWADTEGLADTDGAREGACVLLDFDEGQSTVTLALVFAVTAPVTMPMPPAMAKIRRIEPMMMLLDHRQKFDLPLSVLLP